MQRTEKRPLVFSLGLRYVALGDDVLSQSLAEGLDSDDRQDQIVP